MSSLFNEIELDYKQSMVRGDIKIKDTILEAALPDVAFDGWTWEGIEAAAVKSAYAKDMASAVFPNKLKDAVAHFSDWADRRMMEELSAIDPDTMRVRDRVQKAVEVRFGVLAEHKEAVKFATAYWLRPFRKYEAARHVWRTADRIWIWAGDTATDYNKYTKRALLVGVMTSTMLAWMNDTSSDMARTKAFLSARIDNVMQMGKAIGSVKDRFENRKATV